MDENLDNRLDNLLSSARQAGDDYKKKQDIYNKKRMDFATKSYTSNQNIAQELRKNYVNNLNIVKEQYKGTDLKNIDDDLYNEYLSKRNQFLNTIKNLSASLARMDEAEKEFQQSGAPSSEWNKRDTRLENELEGAYDRLLDLETSYLSGDIRKLNFITKGQTVPQQMAQNDDQTSTIVTGDGELSEKVNISKFLRHLSEKNYSSAHKYLKEVLNSKINNIVAERINKNFK